MSLLGVCVCECVHTHVCACVHMCMCVCVCVCSSLCRAFSLSLSLFLSIVVFLGCFRLSDLCLFCVCHISVHAEHNKAAVVWIGKCRCCTYTCVFVLLRLQTTSCKRGCLCEKHVQSLWRFFCYVCAFVCLSMSALLSFFRVFFYLLWPVLSHFHPTAIALVRCVKNHSWK